MPIVQKRYRKQLKEYKSPHAWKVLESVKNWGKSENNIRMMPHAQLDHSWSERFAGTPFLGVFIAFVHPKLALSGD